MNARRSFSAAALILLFAVLPARPARGELSAEDVRKSLDKAVAFLKREQSGAGQWNEHPSVPSGVTALCTLALLSAGEAPTEAHVAKALTYLRGAKPKMTYSVALQTMVFSAAEPDKDALKIRDNVAWLVSNQIKEGDRRGAWSYPAGAGDNSNTQFALLALHEAERAGVDVPIAVWERSLDYWKRCQNADGSWGYYKGIPGSGSMTSAGITSVIICTQQLSQGDAKAEEDQVSCCGDQERMKEIDNALNWLGRNFSVRTNPSSMVGLGGARGSTWLLYYLYGMERVGRLTTRRFIGKHDWYREGADYLVSMQDDLSGFWKGVGHAEDDPHVATGLALLFMSKGRRPILVAKAQHGPDNDWNRHRSDLANLTAHVEVKWKRDLTWQVMNVTGAKVEDLLQAPVLFISGSQPPDFKPEEVKMLRDYLDRGGFIFAEACCPKSEGFDTAFRKLVEQMFDDGAYRLRPLPPQHPAYYAEETVNLDHAPVLEGVDYGCRTSIIYSPPPQPGGPSGNLSCHWELAQGRDRGFSAKVQAEVEAALAIGINVLAYATNREIKFKDENFVVPLPEDAPDDVDRSKLRVAKLQHAGGCDAAPGALTNLLRSAGRELNIRVAEDHPQLPLTSEQLFDYHLVFMHGRHTFRFTDAERKQLRLFVERGGTLLADSICSSREFSQAFRREIEAAFADQNLQLEEIPENHPMFGKEFGGFDLKSVTRREPQARAGAGPLRAAKREGAPELEGLKVGDRYAVIFSKYDLSCALEKHDSLECEGYTREDAERIGLNVILYSLHQ